MIWAVSYWICMTWHILQSCPPALPLPPCRLQYEAPVVAQGSRGCHACSPAPARPPRRPGRSQSPPPPSRGSQACPWKKRECLVEIFFKRNWNFKNPPGRAGTCSIASTLQRAAGRRRASEGILQLNLINVGVILLFFFMQFYSHWMMTGYPRLGKCYSSSKKNLACLFIISKYQTNVILHPMHYAFNAMLI